MKCMEKTYSQERVMNQLDIHTHLESYLSLNAKLNNQAFKRNIEHSGDVREGKDYKQNPKSAYHKGKN